MKNVKQVTLLFLFLVFSFSLCGCTRISQTLVMGEKGMINHFKIAYDKEKTDKIMSEEGETVTPSEDIHIENIDGKDYYVEENAEATSYADMMKSNPSFIVSSDTYFYKADKVYDDYATPDVPKQEEVADDMFEKITITVTFPKPVLATNGTLSADGCSVTWEYDSSAIANVTSVFRYAYTGAENVAADTATVERRLRIAADRKKPVIKGIKNKKVYKKKSITFYVKDNTGIKSIKLNGKKVKLIKKKSGKYKNYYKVTAKKQGRNTVTVTDLNGNKKTIKFTLKKTK